MQKAGVPDFILCVCGAFVAIELKAPGGKTTPLQAHTIEQIQKAGGRAVVCDSLDAVKSVVETSIGRAMDEQLTFEA